ncbi:MAG: RelA/SpoT family protein [bacterium]|nr:RelA/SpoT family protein [bacterium]
MVYSLEQLVTTITRKKLKVNLDLIQLAYEFAEQAHAGQKRLSGEDYIQHSLATAIKLASLGLDEATIVAGLLHDVPEDTTHTIAEIEKEFGGEIAGLVSGITKLGKIKYRGMERYIENLRKMFIAMAEDVRVIFIKFADRIHNLQTLGSLPPEKQQRVAVESLEIYAAIANRLGMGELKGQLEDLSFPYLYPKEYAWTKKIMEEKLPEQQAIVDKAAKEIRKKLAEAGFPKVDVHGRVKHLWSLYKKLTRKDTNGNVDAVYDLVALRVIAERNDLGDCYAILGAIHRHWPPLPGRIKDYIAAPKPNGYQSLHTTVLGPEKAILEIQIRTPEMHAEAELGIAAHFIYEELGKRNASSKELPRKLQWLEGLLRWQKDAQEHPEQFLKHLKMDFFEDRIFVFSPLGDVVDLPEGATPVDFAYAIHTDLGNSCVGVTVNDKHTNLSHKLKSGDVVEVVTDRHRKSPSEDWLKFIKTNVARHKIREGLKKEKKLF